MSCSCIMAGLFPSNGCLVPVMSVLSLSDRCFVPVPWMAYSCPMDVLFLSQGWHIPVQWMSCFCLVSALRLKLKTKGLSRVGVKCEFPKASPSCGRKMVGTFRVSLKLIIMLVTSFTKRCRMLQRPNLKPNTTHRELRTKPRFKAEPSPYREDQGSPKR